jgi:WD40 repeat protein
LLTACHNENRLQVWDVATARVRKVIPLDSMEFVALVLSPDETRVAVTQIDVKSGKQFLTELDMASGKSLFTNEGSALAYSPDHRWLATLAPDQKEILLLDTRTHEIAARFTGHENVVFKAAFNLDSSLLATCSRDHTVRVWEVTADAWRLAGKTEAEGKNVAVSNGQSVPPPTTRHPPPCKVLSGHTDQVYAVAFHPDGMRLATGGQDGAVWLWDVARGEEIVRMPGHKAYVWSLAFSPDGSTLASGSGDRTVRLWDTAPLRNRYQARREAAALRPEADRFVEQLWRAKNGPTEVAEALRTDPMRSEALRQATWRALLRRVQPPDAVPGKPPPP